MKDKLKLQRMAWLLPTAFLLSFAATDRCASQTSARSPKRHSDWTVPVGAKLEGLKMLDGWTDPREVKGDVNTVGWSDSSYLLGSAAKGYELHYSYSRYSWEDLQRHKKSDVGPVRPGQPFPTFKLYKATVKNGEWVSELLPFNPPDAIDTAAAGMAEGGSPYVFVRFVPRAGVTGLTGNIFEIARDAKGVWGTPVELPFPVNTKCVQDNPTLSADGLTLYFDSNRKDAAATECLTAKTGIPFTGRRSIFVSHFRDGRWSDPVAVAGVPNQQGPSNMQAFLSVDGRRLYWTASRPECPAINCFFRATAQPDGSFQHLVMVAEPTPVGPNMDGKIIALGESSVSEDGKLMAFVYVRAHITGKDTPLAGPADKLDIGIALARRVRPGR